MTELHHLTLTELNEGLRLRRYSSVELTRHFLGRIDRHNPALNALITVTAEHALAQAARADQLLAAGEAPPLAGLPLVHKDIFCTDGVLTTCASRMLANFVAPYDATVIERLAQAGAVMLGKSNMDEFAMGSSNETSWYGPVRIPWDLGRVRAAAGTSQRSRRAVTTTDAPASPRPWAISNSSPRTAGHNSDRACQIEQLAHLHTHLLSRPSRHRDPTPSEPLAFLAEGRPHRRDQLRRGHRLGQMIV